MTIHAQSHDYHVTCLQEAEVVKIQAFLRAKKAKKDYKQLGKRRGRQRGTFRASENDGAGICTTVSI